MPRTLFEKVWNAHIVKAETVDTPAVLYVDLHLVHEVTSPQAFSLLRERGLKVRRPERTLSTMDHSTPTTPRAADGRFVYGDAQCEAQVAQLTRNTTEFQIELHQLGDAAHGIVHVMGPELGATQPGMTVVCGDSHTATHGAFGALAFGIGTSEVGYVLATQCLLQRRPKTLLVNVEGQLGFGVTAKDLILAIIAKLGVGGGTGYVAEYAGPAVRALSMDERMTVSNMSIEMGARAGMIAPDETTFQYLAGRAKAPAGKAWDAAVAKPKPFTDHVFEVVAGRKDLSQPRQRSELLQELLPVVRLIEEPVFQAHYVQRLARLTQTPEDLLRSELRRRPSRACDSRGSGAARTSRPPPPHADPARSGSRRWPMPRPGARS